MTGIEGWATADGWPPVGAELRTPSGLWRHSHPCPAVPGHGWDQAVYDGRGEPHGYRWSCEHETHGGVLPARGPFPRPLLEQVWRVEEPDAAAR